MSALNSSLVFVSAVASSSGLNSLSQESFRLRTPRKVKQRVKLADPTYKPLSARKREELMQSILHDDWHE
ncbi:hypothetical protein [Rhizobium sp.]